MMLAMCALRLLGCVLLVDLSKKGLIPFRSWQAATLQLLEQYLALALLSSKDLPHLGQLVLCINVNLSVNLTLIINVT